MGTTERASHACAIIEPAGQALRAWVPGCSTGEEAYSLAMVFKEALEQVKPSGRHTLQVFATDLDRDAIDKARQGFFPANIAADVSPERLHRFFIKEDSRYRAGKEIREMVIFAPQNVIMDPPFTKLDILSCRNLLIYLFLDSNLNARRFTTSASRIINLIPGDVGRPVTDIASSLLYPELAADAREVLRSVVVAEKEIATRDGRWFGTRIMPYRTVDNRIDGVVVAFADISAAKRLEAELRMAHSESETRVTERTDDLAQAKDMLKTETAKRKRMEDAAGKAPGDDAAGEVKR